MNMIVGYEFHKKLVFLYFYYYHYLFFFWRGGREVGGYLFIYSIFLNFILKLIRFYYTQIHIKFIHYNYRIVLCYILLMNKTISSLKKNNFDLSLTLDSISMTNAEKLLEYT